MEAWAERTRGAQGVAALSSVELSVELFSNSIYDPTMSRTAVPGASK